MCRGLVTLHEARVLLGRAVQFGPDEKARRSGRDRGERERSSRNHQPPSVNPSHADLLVVVV